MTLKERARALKTADPSLSNSEIARRLGTGKPLVWKALNPEKALESDRKSRDKRRERRREIDREYTARLRSTCETCGEPCGIGSGRNDRPSKQCRLCFEAPAEIKRQRIQTMWSEGASGREIAEAIGTTVGALRIYMHEMRRDGWDLPYRYRIVNGRRAA